MGHYFWSGIVLVVQEGRFCVCVCGVGARVREEGVKLKPSMMTLVT